MFGGSLRDRGLRRRRAISSRSGAAIEGAAAGLRGDRRGRLAEEGDGAALGLRERRRCRFDRVLPRRQALARPPDRRADAAGGPQRSRPTCAIISIVLLGSDRLTTRGESPSWCFTPRARTALRSADIEAIVSDAAPSALDAPIDALFSAIMAGSRRPRSRYFSDGGDAGLLRHPPYRARDCCCTG